MINKEKNNYAINSIELLFFYKKTDKKIVDEVKEKIDAIALKYETEVKYEFKEVDSEKIKMEMYNHLTPNQHLTDDYFKFYKEFLLYTNEVENKYSNFVTLPMD